MVGYLYPEEKKRLFVRPQPLTLCDLSLAAAGVPPGERGLRQAGRALARLGVRRCLAPPGFPAWEGLSAWGLAPVDVLPLCRALAPDMVLFLLDDLPIRHRRVALRGSDGRQGWSLAHLLCPRVGALLLDFDRGEEELGASLRREFGAAPRSLGQGGQAQVSVEFSPRPFGEGRVLKLWGEPDLAGLELSVGWPLPQEADALELLTLLWEMGRLKREKIQVAFALDRQEENSYNIHHC